MVIEQKTTKTAKTTTLSGLITGFLSSRRQLSPRTMEYYRMVLSNFHWYARSQKWPDDPNNITREHIREFLDYVSTESYRWPTAQRSSCKKAAPATIHHYGKVVKTLFNWAEDEEYLPLNPTRRLKLGSPRYKEVEPYSDDEIRAMLTVCENDAAFRYRYLGIRNTAIISLFVATGLRVEEMAGIQMPEIDPKLGQVRVMGKGSKARVVPISREARKSLRRYLQIRPPGGDALWLTDDGQPMTVYGVKVMVQRLKVRAGIEGGGGAHRFRHYFATSYLEAGGDINSLRLLLGHSSLDMVLKYSRKVDVRRALAQHDQFDPLERLTQNKSSRGNNHREDWDWQR